MKYENVETLLIENSRFKNRSQLAMKLMYSCLHIFTIFGVTLILLPKVLDLIWSVKGNFMKAGLSFKNFDLDVIQTFNNIDTDVLKTSVK